MTENTSTQPDFRAVGLDVTEHYSLADKDKKHVQRVIDVFFYDRNTRTHCCEITPSYYLQHLYTFLVFQPNTDEYKQDLLDQDYCHEPTDNCYMHTRDIDRLTEFHTPFPCKPGEEPPTEDTVREYWQGNSPF